MKQIVLNIPDKIDKSSFDIAMKLAVNWFNEGLITSGQGAEMTGLTKRKFIERMGEYGGILFNYSLEEIEEDLKNA